MKKLFLLLAATVLATSMALAGTPTPPAPQPPINEVQTGLYVTCNVPDASVYLDGKYKGTAPLLLENLKPGKYRLEVTKNHYDTDTSYVYIDEGKVREARCFIEKISGYLTVNTNPSDATIYCDGRLPETPGKYDYSIKPNQIELDEGSHTITLKKFGYQETSATVYIKRNTESTISLEMTPAEFDILGIHASKAVFNPKNHGGFGNLEITVSVTAPGKGVVQFIDRGGHVIYHEDVEFKSWNTTFEWIGTDYQDYIVDDGEYTATLTAEGKTASTSFSVDSTLTYPMYTMTPSGTGIGSVASAELFPKSTFVLSLEAGAMFNLYNSNPMYGAPIKIGLAWTPAKFLEISGGINGVVAGTFAPSFHASAKAIFKTTMDSGTLYYGGLIRIGGSPEPILPPYGWDAGNGLGAGILVGFKTEGNIYFGLESSWIFRPVDGLSSVGSDSILKNGLMFQKTFDNGSVGLFGTLTSGFGIYESKAGEKIDMNSALKSLELGGKAAFYPFESSVNLGIQAGAILFPAKGFGTLFSDNTVYPYVTANLTWMF